MSTHTDLPQNPTTYYISIPQEVGRYPPVQPDPRPTMGNGVSGDQGNLPSHGKRDVGVTFDRKQHDWSKLAEEQEVNTLMSNVDPYSYNIGIIVYTLISEPRLTCLNTCQNATYRNP